MGGKRKWVSGMTDFVFLLPAFVLFTAVIAIPFIQAVGIAFTNWDGLSKTYQFNGLTNLTALFKDAQTANAVKNTLLYTIATCVGVNVLALAITVGLNANIRGARFCAHYCQPCHNGVYLGAYLRGCFPDQFRDADASYKYEDGGIGHCGDVSLA